MKEPTYLKWSCQPQDLQLIANHTLQLKCCKFIDEEIQLLESAGCISRSLSPLAVPVTVVSKMPDPLHPDKQQLHLVPDYWLLNKSINATHNRNEVTLYYSLPNIADLLARSCNCKILSLDLCSGYNHIGLTPEAKPKAAFATTSGKLYCYVAPFRIHSLPGVFSYLMSQV